MPDYPYRPSFYFVARALKIAGLICLLVCLIAIPFLVDGVAVAGGILFVIAAVVHWLAKGAR